MDTKLIYAVNLPYRVIDRYNINEETVFTARYDDGQIFLESISEAELKERSDTDFDAQLDDSFAEGFVEGRLDGFDDGYEQGYRDSSEGYQYDPDYERFEATHHNTSDYSHGVEMDEIPNNTSMKPQREISLRDFLDRLSTAEKRAALVYLSVKYTEEQRGSEDAD